MPNVEINGTVVSFPDDMKPDQLKQAVSSAATKMRGQTSFQEMSALKGKPLGQQLWKGLEVPEKMAKRGLGTISSNIPQIQNSIAQKTGLPIGTQPTGNLPADIARNIPRIAGETLAEAAPPFVSRASILTSGIAPMIGAVGRGLAPVGRGIASGLEDWSGIGSKGALGKAAKDASLIFARIPDSARKAYQAGNEAISQSPLSKIPSPLKMVQVAMKMAQRGKLSPEEALEARKGVDQLWKSNSITQAFKNSSRKVLDAVVKGDEDLAGADRAFSRGKTAASLRSLVPKNIGGRGSPFKVGEALALSHMGPVGKIASLAFSPLALGTGATVLGGAGRLASNPRSAVAALQAIRKMREMQNENPAP